MELVKSKKGVSKMKLTKFNSNKIKKEAKKLSDIIIIETMNWIVKNAFNLAKQRIGKRK
jgi:hypothetical protein